VTHPFPRISAAEVLTLADNRLPLLILGGVAAGRAALARSAPSATGLRACGDQATCRCQADGIAGGSRLTVLAQLGQEGLDIGLSSKFLACLLEIQAAHEDGRKAALDQIEMSGL
jgi:hypothetical protein